MCRPPPKVLFSAERPRWWNKLTAANTLFVVGHSHNVSRLLSGLKWWEGKGCQTKATFMVYCSKSTQEHREKHAEGQLWSSDDTIPLGHAFTVSRISGFEKGGCEGFNVDWLLCETVKLDPIKLGPSGVGQGGRFPNAKNRHLHIPFKHVKKQLAVMFE